MKTVAFFLIGLVVATGCQKEVAIVPYQEQLENDVATIDSYLNAQGISAEKDSTGNLRFVVTLPTNGRKPVLVDSIRVNYSYSVLKNNTLAATTTSAATISFLLESLIQGWKKIIPLVGEGSKVTIYVPSGLAYGAFQQGRIPPNSNLVFDVELVKVIPEFSRQLNKDIALIDTLLKKQNIANQKDLSGVRYIILNTGAGAVTSLSDTVSITYTGRFLSDNTLFDQATTPKKYLLSKTIRSWQIGILQLQKGGSVRVYSPSGLAFGAYGTTKTQVQVPPSTNVIYDIQLVDIKKN
jgi:FKBP-type peptidyl-prolyl cis-trans isomerase